MRIALAPLCLFLVCQHSFLCNAYETPSGGLFSFMGAPVFATGAWEAVAESSESMVLMAVASAGGSISQRQPSNLSEAITTVITYTSHMCLDDHTFLVTMEGKSYPSNTLVSQCSIIFINETHRAANSLPLESGLCPNAPFSGFSLSPNGAYTTSNIYMYLEGVVERTEFVCRNGTTAEAPRPAPTPATAPAPGQSFTSPPPPPPPPPAAVSPYPPFPNPGGAATPQGVWKTEHRVHIINRQGFWGSIYDVASNSLVARRSRYLSHECLSDSSYRVLLDRDIISMNQTVGDVDYACLAGQLSESGEELDVAVVAAADGPCPESATDSRNNADLYTFYLVDPLTGDPSTTCGAPPPGTSSACRTLPLITLISTIVLIIYSCT